MTGLEDDQSDGLRFVEVRLKRLASRESREYLPGPNTSTISDATRNTNGPPRRISGLKRTIAALRDRLLVGYHHVAHEQERNQAGTQP